MKQNEAIYGFKNVQSHNMNAAHQKKNGTNIFLNNQHVPETVM